MFYDVGGGRFWEAFEEKYCSSTLSHSDDFHCFLYIAALLLSVDVYLSIELILIKSLLYCLINILSSLDFRMLSLFLMVWFIDSGWFFTGGFLTTRKGIIKNIINSSFRCCCVWGIWMNTITPFVANICFMRCRLWFGMGFLAKPPSSGGECAVPCETSTE